MESMGIVKIQINFVELKKSWNVLKTNRGQFFEQLTQEMRKGISQAITDLMNSEMTVFLGQFEQKNNKRNGYEIKNYALKGVGGIEIKIPIDRKREFKSDLIPKGERLDPRLKEDLAVLHLAGLSNRTLELISRRLLGVDLGKDQVHKSLQIIEEKALNWLQRPLEQKYWALYVDGTNFYLQRKGETQREPSLVVLGVSEKNTKSILSITPGSKENAKTWEVVFEDLIKRGLDPKSVRIGIMDGLSGLEQAFKTVFTKAQTARCWVHAKKNALAKSPARYREAFEKRLTDVMYASSEKEAKEAFFRLKNELSGEAQRAIQCIERDLDSLLVHYRFDRKYWIALKTTNPIERVNRELKRRSKSMGTMGERTLMCLQAFTALKLEMNWKNTPIDSVRLENLQQMKQWNIKTNQIEEAFKTLLQ